MGWSSGTEIFDNVAEEIMCDKDISINDDSSIRLLKVLNESLEDKDWDCQCESEYWSHPIIGKILGNEFSDE